MANIEVRHDSQRGCGWRQPGGLYLVADGISRPCDRLPLICERCPCCDAGIKPTRGWTWVRPRLLFKDEPCMSGDCRGCMLEPGHEPAEAGLLWIGEQHYPTPSHWIEESTVQGVSRRIPALPNGFVCGETWVLVAHRKAVHDACPYCHGGEKMLGCKTCDGRGEVLKPAIFHAFKPKAVEYVVRTGDRQEKLDANEKRGIVNVMIERRE